MAIIPCAQFLNFGFTVPDKKKERRAEKESHVAGAVMKDECPSYGFEDLIDVEQRADYTFSFYRIIDNVKFSVGASRYRNRLFK